MFQQQGYAFRNRPGLVHGIFSGRIKEIHKPAAYLAIWSDNAKNFVGAKNELADLRQLFLSDPHTSALSNLCVSNGIDWKFIPSRSPHF